MSSNGHHPDDPTVTLPPHNNDAERALLGSLFIDEMAYFDVAHIVATADFFSGLHRLVFNGIVESSNNGGGLDRVTLGAWLEERSKPPEGGWQAFLFGLAVEVPTSVNAPKYARLVADLATRRRAIRAAQHVAKVAFDQKGHLPDQLNEMESAIFDIRGQLMGEVRKPRVYMSDYLSQYDRLRNQDGRELLGLATGLADLDRLLAGLQAPHLYVLAARPAMGKSALALNITDHIARKGGHVAFFSLEMSESQLASRRIASLTGIDSRLIQRPWGLSRQFDEQVRRAIGELSELPVFLDTTPIISPAEIRAKCIRLHANHGLDLVVVDHLILMRPDRERTRSDQEYGEMTQSLAALGKALDCPILLVTQLNRGVESRQDKRPLLSDLRESGRIEENAYAVMFLYRDDYYNEMSERQDIAEVIIAKHRDGPTGTVDLFWKAKTVTLKNLQRQEIRL